MSVFLRSCLFVVFKIIITPPFAILSLLTFPFGAFTRYRIISTWTRTVLWAVEAICGIRYKVIGAGNIPAEPCVVLSKHQSAWETLAFQVIFPPQVYVLKRELLWIPFFGWGLAMMSPVAIDRRAGVRALKQMLSQGRERLKRGFWIIVFPEGTRTAPGSRGTYQTGGAAIAVSANAPALPVAHNAGRYWGRRGLLKLPGCIRVVIGPAIETAGRDPREVSETARQWMDAKVAELGG